MSRRSAWTDMPPSAQPFASTGAVPRAARDKHAEKLAQGYAVVLEGWCFRAPYQWFNFFEFWRDKVEK